MVIGCNEDADRVRLYSCELGMAEGGRVYGLIPVKSGILEALLQAVGCLPRPIQRKDVVDVLYAGALVGTRETRGGEPRVTRPVAKSREVASTTEHNTSSSSSLVLARVQLMM